MPKTLTQIITFKGQKTSALYSMYLDSKLHAEITGGHAAKITAKEGAEYVAHDGYCFGKNLQLIKNKLIVQSWRATDWQADDIDSTFILSFNQRGNDAVITMVHANVPDDQAAGLKEGWNDFYWIPWKEYLKRIR
jgi:activator of HSP90 ATPase